MLTLCATKGVSISNVHADFNAQTGDEGRLVHIRMKDLSGDAEKEVLFDLSIPALDVPVRELAVLTCSLSYVDVADGVAKTQDSTLTLSGVQNGQQSIEPDVAVEAHRCRLLAAKAMEQAAVMLGEGARAKYVHDVLCEALASLEESLANLVAFQSCNDNGAALAQERVAAFSADIRDCLEILSDPRSCEKLCSSRSFAHKHQISTKAEGSEYRNSLQQSLAEAARREMIVPSQQELPARQGRPGNGRKAFKPPSRLVAIHAGPMSSSDAMPAGAVRAGMRLLCHGHPGLVKEVSMSKTGKHGHAKVFFVVLGDDGKVREDVVPASHDVLLAP